MSSQWLIQEMNILWKGKRKDIVHSLDCTIVRISCKAVQLLTSWSFSKFSVHVGAKRKTEIMKIKKKEENERNYYILNNKWK